MRESSAYQLILDEDVEKGLSQGQLQARREDLLDILNERFGVVPAELEQQLLQILDLPRLKALLRQAVRISSLDELQLDRVEAN